VYLDADNDGTLDAGERSTATDAAGNYFFGALSPGTYRVRQVVAAGYAGTAPPGGVHVVNVAAGQSVTGVRFGARALPGEIRGTKWHDLNGNRVRDAGEPGLAGWTIYLDADQDGALDAGEASTVTDAAGAYAFPALPARHVRVAEVQQAGWEQTYPGGGAAAAAAGGAVRADANGPAKEPAVERGAARRRTSSRRRSRGRRTCRSTPPRSSPRPAGGS
jgi:hypothetical protein